MVAVRADLALSDPAERLQLAPVTALEP